MLSRRIATLWRQATVTRLARSATLSTRPYSEIADGQMTTQSSKAKNKGGRKPGHARFVPAERIPEAGEETDSILPETGETHARLVTKKTQLNQGDHSPAEREVLFGDSKELRQIREMEKALNAHRTTYPRQRASGALPDLAISGVRQPKRGRGPAKPKKVFLPDDTNVDTGLFATTSPGKKIKGMMKTRVSGQIDLNKALDNLLLKLDPTAAPKTRKRIKNTKRGRKPDPEARAQWRKEYNQKQRLTRLTKIYGAEVATELVKLTPRNRYNVPRKPFSAPMTKAEKEQLGMFGAKRPRKKRGPGMKINPKESAEQFLKFLHDEAERTGKVPKFRKRKQFNKHELEVSDIVYSNRRLPGLTEGAIAKTPTKEPVRVFVSPKSDEERLQAYLKGATVKGWISPEYLESTATNLVTSRDEPLWAHQLGQILERYRVQELIPSSELYNKLLTRHCASTQSYRDVFLIMDEIADMDRQISLEALTDVVHAATRFERLEGGLKVRLPQILRQAISSGIHPASVLTQAYEATCRFEVEKALIGRRNTRAAQEYPSSLPSDHVVYAHPYHMVRGEVKGRTIPPLQAQFREMYPESSQPAVTPPYYTWVENTPDIPHFIIDHPDDDDHLYAFNVSYLNNASEDGDSLFAYESDDRFAAMRERIAEEMGREFVVYPLIITADGQFHTESERILHNWGVSKPDFHKLSSTIADASHLFSAWIRMSSQRELEQGDGDE